MIRSYYGQATAILISTGKPMFFFLKLNPKTRHAGAKQLKKRKTAEQKLHENEKLEIARFLPWSVSSLSLSKHDLTDDMRGSIDEITKGSAITAALSSAD